MILNLNKFPDARVPDGAHAESYENTVNIFLSEQNITLSDAHIDPSTNDFKSLVETIKENLTQTAKMPDALFVTLFESLKSKEA